MASSSSSPNNRIAFAQIILIILLAPTTHATATCFKSIVSFGDSLTDTGNSLYLSQPSNTTPRFALPPCGKSLFRPPTGRSSDGRLIIDFIAERFGLPYIPPFFSRKFCGGVNFAVGGATALPDSFFAGKGIRLPIANVSLAYQFGWFKEKFLPTFCRKTADCEDFLKTTLVLLGEIGGNDYNYPFFVRRSVESVRPFIPEVVNTIISTVEELIELGAVTIMVPGNLPFGCSGFYLTYYKSSNETDYDKETGCLKWPNRFAQDHNKLLRSELNRIQVRNPKVHIIYADYYNAAMKIYRSPQKYGFTEGALKACCGGGGLYNVNITAPCKSPGSTTCQDPSLYVSWDGLHLTEAAYKWIANGILRGPYTSPRLKTVCALS